MGPSVQEMKSATLSNYLHFALRILLSLILVRIMYMGMENEAYGFWALLWSIFGYSVLLDFGMGTTIQKKVSSLQQEDKTQALNTIFSTYILIYILISMIILVSTFFLGLFLEDIFRFEQHHRINEYKTAFYIFGCGSALAFIFGFFAEVLRGLHLLQVRNKINSVFLVLNLLVLWACVQLELSLVYLSSAAVIILILNNFCFFIALKVLHKGFHFDINQIDILDVKQSLSFSFSAYIIMLSNVMIFKTDQIIIGAFAGVAFAAHYQIILRLSEIYRQLSTQFFDSLLVKSAALAFDKKSKELALLMKHSTEVCALISTAFFVPIYLLIEPLLDIWLKLDNQQALLSAKVLLISMYVLILFRSAMVQVLLMDNKHKELMFIGLFEAGANIGLSIILVKDYGILGVALGTLIPNVLMAVFYNIPLTLKHSHWKFSQYLMHFIIPLCICLFSSIYIFEYLFLSSPAENIFQVLYQGIFIFCTYILLHILLVLSSKQKKELVNWLKSILLILFEKFDRAKNI